MINNNYVLLNNLNIDVLDCINQYILNPYIEIRETALNKTKKIKNKKKTKRNKSNATTLLIMCRVLSPDY